MRSPRACCTGGSPELSRSPIAATPRCARRPLSSPSLTAPAARRPGSSRSGSRGSLPDVRSGSTSRAAGWGPSPSQPGATAASSAPMSTVSSGDLRAARTARRAPRSCCPPATTLSRPGRRRGRSSSAVRRAGARPPARSCASAPISPTARFSAVSAPRPGWRAAARSATPGSPPARTPSQFVPSAPSAGRTQARPTPGGRPRRRPLRSRRRPPQPARRR